MHVPHAFLATAILLIGRVAAADPSPPAAPTDPGALRDFTRAVMEESRVRGAAVAVWREGRPVWIETFGVADERSGAPVTRRTVFQAASLGKVVAAWAALIEIEDGTWSLEMPARSSRMPLRVGCDPPTLGELLSHTAGLGNDLSARHFEAACHPPAPFAYAGQGYLVLQDLFGDASGERAERFVQQRIFQPLAMVGATFGAPSGDDVATGHADLVYGLLSGDAVGPSRTAGLVGVAAAVSLLGVALAWMGRRTGGVRAALFGAVGVLVGAAVLAAAGAAAIAPLSPRAPEIRLPSSLQANIDDLATFAGELLEPTLVSRAARDRLFEPRVRVDDELSWSSGIGIERTGDVVSWWQWGSNPGFQSLLVVVPERRAAVVVLTNTGGFSDVLLGTPRGHAMAKRVARRVLGVCGRWDLRHPAPVSRGSAPCGGDLEPGLALEAQASG